jgi:membrane-associated phospholipid phosphatase
VILQIDNMDERVSDWASDHTPLFGSQEDAGTASDRLRDATTAAYLITSMAAPSGDKPKKWLFAKARGLAVGFVAIGVTGNVTSFLKDETERTRPDGSNDRSFPSAHASISSAFATLASRNLDSLPISSRNRTLLHVGFSTLAAGTAWARVEAKRHFPADVLAGYALGHFFSAFFNDAFLGLDKPSNFMLSVEPSKNGVAIGLRLVF